MKAKSGIILDNLGFNLLEKYANTTTWAVAALTAQTDSP
jgi:hypothetical protein